MGLLDAFYSQGTTPPNPDATFPQILSSPMGQGLLGAIASYAANARRGAPVNSIGAGLLGGLAGYQNAGQEDLKRKYMQTQMADMEQQQKLREQQAAQLQRRNDMINGWLGQLDGAVPAANQAVAAQTGNLTPTRTNAALQTQAVGQTQASNPLFGVPREAIKADLAFNDGKNVPEWMFKRGVPDMQVSNGYAYNKNDLRPGFLPQFNVSQDGKASLTQIDANGQPVVSAPPGALDTYSAFRQAEEAAKAGSDLVKVYNPATQREEYITRSQAVRATQPAPQQPAPTPQRQVQVASAQPGVSGNFVGSPDAVMAAINEIRNPQERANALAAFQEQARRTPGFNQGGAFAAGPSTSEATNAAADKERAVQTVKDVAEQRKGIMNAGFVAPSNIARYQQIGKLLQDVDGGALTPAGTHLASLANSLGVKIDKNLPNKEAAASLANAAALELRNPAGGAGMPGAMSDADRNFLASMTPNMAQSAQGRKQVIDTYIAVQTRNQQVAQFARNYEKKYGKLDNGFFDQLSAWSATNPLFKGK